MVSFFLEQLQVCVRLCRIAVAGKVGLGFFDLQAPGIQGVQRFRISCRHCGTAGGWQSQQQQPAAFPRSCTALPGTSCTVHGAEWARGSILPEDGRSPRAEL